MPPTRLRLCVILTLATCCSGCQGRAVPAAQDGGGVSLDALTTDGPPMTPCQLLAARLPNGKRLTTRRSYQAKIPASLDRIYLLVDTNDGGEVLQVSLPGGVVTPLTTKARQLQLLGGRGLLVTKGVTGDPTYLLTAILTTGQVHALGTNVVQHVISPTGDRVYLLRRSGLGATVKLEWFDLPSGTRNAQNIVARPGSLILSPDGKYLAYQLPGGCGGATSSAYVLATRGTKPVLVAAEVQAGSMQFLPDGRLLYFQDLGCGGQPWLRICAPDGKGQGALSQGLALVKWAEASGRPPHVTSTDGKLVSGIDLTAPGRATLLSIRTDGGGHWLLARDLLPPQTTPLLMPQNWRYSHDGARMAYARVLDKSVGLALIATSYGTPVTLTPSFRPEQFRFSPTDDTLVYVDTQGVGDRVKATAPGKTPWVIHGDISNIDDLTFLSDGRGILFRVANGASADLYFSRPSSGKPVKLAHWSSNYLNAIGPRWELDPAACVLVHDAADGTHLAVLPR